MGVYTDLHLNLIISSKQWEFIASLMRTVKMGKLSCFVGWMLTIGASYSKSSGIFGIGGDHLNNATFLPSISQQFLTWSK
jgi:hypothetical protein